METSVDRCTNVLEGTERPDIAVDRALVFEFVTEFYQICKAAGQSTALAAAGEPQRMTAKVPAACQPGRLRATSTGGGMMPRPLALFVVGRAAMPPRAIASQMFSISGARDGRSL